MSKINYYESLNTQGKQEKEVVGRRGRDSLPMSPTFVTTSCEKSEISREPLEEHPLDLKTVGKPCVSDFKPLSEKEISEFKGCGKNFYHNKYGKMICGKSYKIITLCPKCQEKLNKKKELLKQVEEVI